MSEALRSGLILGPYVLMDELGVGGMAQIWSAQQLLPDGTKNTYALKILKPQHVNITEFRGMFHDEMAIASQLEHDNVVRIHGAAEFGGYLIQVMELIDGRDLATLLKIITTNLESVPVQFALVIGREVARAMAYVHEQCDPNGEPMNIVHRDLSPNNIMLTRAGGVKVVDFGIARAEQRLTQTQSGMIKGKFGYMAPEQAMGGTVSPRTDIFALGIVLWEMLSLQHLFEGRSDVESAQKVIEGHVPPLVAINKSVPPDGDALIQKMLARSDANRPADMREVERDLTRIIFQHYTDEVTAKEAFSIWVTEVLKSTEDTLSTTIPSGMRDELLDTLPLSEDQQEAMMRLREGIFKEQEQEQEQEQDEDEDEDEDEAGLHPPTAPTLEMEKPDKRSEKPTIEEMPASLPSLQMVPVAEKKKGSTNLILLGVAGVVIVVVLLLGLSR